jgi:hypothetical protein
MREGWLDPIVTRIASSSFPDSWDFAGPNLYAAQQSLQREIRILGQVADSLAVLQLLPHFFRPDASVHPRDEKVVEHIGAFSDQASAVTCHGLDQAFDGFLTELLSDPCPADVLNG